MARKLKVGLVGTGDIGRLHARALQTRAEVELCVCVGVKPEGAEAFARDFGAKVYASYSEMLSDPSVDAVDRSGKGQPGGYFTSQCRIVTFWYQ